METPNTTTIKIQNIDGSYRVIKPIGNYTYELDLRLAKDLEKEGFKDITIHK